MSRIMDADCRQSGMSYGDLGWGQWSGKVPSRNLGTLGLKYVSVVPKFGAYATFLELQLSRIKSRHSRQ